MKGPNNIAFILFSYLGSGGTICRRYFVSTTVRDLLQQFIIALHEHFEPKHKIRNPDMLTERDIYLDREDHETIFLPEKQIEDIDRQVLSFFANRSVYQKLNIPYRRGLLFVGHPGCGKTMMIRRLVRMRHRDFHINFVSLIISRSTGEGEVAHLFQTTRPRTAEHGAILEDLDSLTRESSCSRSALLNQLDGLLRPTKAFSFSARPTTLRILIAH